MTLVSVIVPTHNRMTLLTTRCLPSIQNQTHQELDIIVVGDGTDQETVDAMREVMRTDERIRFWNLPPQVYPEDLGQKWCLLGLEALNFGLDHAEGEWETRLADDDEFTLDHVAVLLVAALATEADVAYGRTVAHWVDGHTSYYGNWPPGHFQFTDNALCKTSLGYRYDPTCIDRGLPEDGDLWDRMVAGGVEFIFVDQVLTHYYPNPR